MKAAVYTGTRNTYENMVIAAKSLLIHSDVDVIYCLIEDDDFPFEYPSEIKCINVSNQTYFPETGASYNNNWTYMVLLRAALTKFFPDLDTILSLDIDTIIDDNISELWDYDVTDYYLAAVKEIHKSKPNFMYINMGVVLFNLKKMREDHMDDRIIHELNTVKHPFNEQDVINIFCQGKVLELPSMYNVNNYTTPTTTRKILHFAAVKNWKTLPIITYYKNLPFRRNVTRQFGLDIIIPTYKDPEQLDITLSHIAQDARVRVTVVDDASGISYDELRKKYPYVRFIMLDKNSGPGVCRQTGINMTTNPYIMFIDTGDYLFSDTSLKEIKTNIINNPSLDRYKFQWFNEEHSSFSNKGNNLLHGTVYSREFLEIYNIHFCAESSYSNEDVGFNHVCQLVIANMGIYDRNIHEYFFEIPIYFYKYDTNSITHANNGEFIYTKHIRGLTINTAHVIKMAIFNKVHHELIGQEISARIAELYFYFLKCIAEKPEYAAENWKYIHDFYNAIIKPNTELVNQFINMGYTQYMRMIVNMARRAKIQPNIQIFLKELAANDTIPPRYLQ